MADPVSWLLIERGWHVHGSDGEHIGRVDEVTGDTVNDIFNGLVVTAGLFRATKYVPAERVVEIVEGRVTIDVDAEGFQALDDHAPGAGTPAD
jgi:uncharacterized protein YrrD